MDNTVLKIELDTTQAEATIDALTAKVDALQAKVDALNDSLSCPAVKTFDVQIINTPAGLLGATHLTPRNAK